MANEKRLIDANALGIGRAKREVFDKPAYADGWNSAIDVIENAPTVDAVEVVRCKDCIYYHKQLGYGFGQCSKYNIMPYPDDFCSYGERKDNDNA